MMKYKYTLDKISNPGWTFETDYINEVFRQLDRYVCKTCKLTENDYINDPRFSDAPEDYWEFMPEDYQNLPTSLKVDKLLDTACGCEFMFEENE